MADSSHRGLETRAAPARRLLKLVESIADRGSVDPSWLRSGREGSELPIDGLERLTTVVAGYRQIQRSSTEHSPARKSREPLFRWGQLEVLEEIGRGSFGQVYRAFDPLLEREVALKLYAEGAGRDRAAERRYVEEARRLARVRHPNVLAIFGAELQDDRLGIWTELISGLTLEEWLATAGKLGAPEATAIGLDLCRALAAVHAAGIVHGDVKAANVLREEGGRIVLADFGAAREQTPSSAAGPTVTGSPLAMAPEVLAGAAAEPVSDLYSLGVLLFRLVSGRYPVEANDLDELLDRHRRGERCELRQLRPELPLALVAAVDRAVAVEAPQRYGSAGEMERALAATLVKATGDPSTAAPRLPAKSSPSRPFRRRPLLLLTLSAVFLAVAAALFLKLSPDSTAPATIGDAVESRSFTLSTALPAPSFDVTAELYRVRGGESRVVLPGTEVRPGDRLFLELATSEAAYLYVLNEDEEGTLVVLFPLPDVALTNPLTATTTHRLPAPDQDWQVTSAGGTETFLLIVSRQPLDDLEHELEPVERARADRLLSGGAPEILRSVGGLVAAETDGSGGSLGLIQDSLRARQLEEGGIWLRRIEILSAEP